MIFDIGVLFAADFISESKARSSDMFDKSFKVQAKQMLLLTLRNNYTFRITQSISTIKTLWIK